MKITQPKINGTIKNDHLIPSPHLNEKNSYSSLPKSIDVTNISETAKNLNTEPSLDKIDPGNFKAAVISASKVAKSLAKVPLLPISTQNEDKDLKKLENKINQKTPEINFIKKDIEDFVSLGHYINKPIITYSEGMKARVSICGVLYSNPDILLIDEGIGAGDRFFVEKARKTIDLKLKSSPILFVASHSEELLRNFCDKIIILVSGKIVKYSNTEEALRYYVSEDFKKKIC